MFFGDDRDYQRIQEMKRNGMYAFATCYDIDWGLLLPCESGVVFEQQTDGCCCHHVYLEGVLTPLSRPIERTGTNLLVELQEANYHGRPTYAIWDRIRAVSAFWFTFIDAPPGMPPNQEGFQWILYHGHNPNNGMSVSIEGWKDQPIVLIYPNSD
jgi:hypothetical protein